MLSDAALTKVMQSMVCQENWGWYLGVAHESEQYLTGVNGNGDESTTNKNEGEWRITVDKSRSLGQRLRGSGKITQGPIVAVIEEILLIEGDFKDLHHAPREFAHPDFSESRSFNDFCRR